MPLDVDAVAITGRWLRHGPDGAAALPIHVSAPDNRWQRGDVVQALYLADEENTAWAEWYRHLAEAGIPPPALQAIGEQLAVEDWAGLLAPSAARPAHRVLCLFRRGGNGRAAPSGARPVGRPRRVTEPPVPPTGMTT